MNTNRITKILTLITAALFTNLASAEWRSSIPEAQPGTQEFEQTRTIIERARGNPDYGYQQAKFFTVIAESAFAIGRSGKIEMFIVANGKYFNIPLELDHVDNWSTWARRKGDKRGIYMIQRGHRRAGGVLWRVVATMRLTQLDGTAFPAVEYIEETSKEACPECIK